MCQYEHQHHLLQGESLLRNQSVDPDKPGIIEDKNEIMKINATTIVHQNDLDEEEFWLAGKRRAFIALEEAH
jgi:hypothetical protein